MVPHITACLYKTPLVPTSSEETGRDGKFASFRRPRRGCGLAFLIGTQAFKIKQDVLETLL